MPFQLSLRVSLMSAYRNTSDILPFLDLTFWRIGDAVSLCRIGSPALYRFWCNAHIPEIQFVTSIYINFLCEFGNCHVSRQITLVGIQYILWPLSHLEIYFVLHTFHECISDIIKIYFKIWFLFYLDNWLKIYLEYASIIIAWLKNIFWKYLLKSFFHLSPFY